MPIPLEELPPRMRKELLASLAAHPSRGETAPPPAQRLSGKSGRGRWRCHTCGEEHKALAAMERHCHANNHLRYECVF